MNKTMKQVIEENHKKSYENYMRNLKRYRKVNAIKNTIKLSAYSILMTLCLFIAVIYLTIPNIVAFITFVGCSMFSATRIYKIYYGGLKWKK